MAQFGHPSQIKVSSQQLIISVSIKEPVTSLVLVMCGVDRPAIVGKHCLIKVTAGCRGRNRVSQWCPETKAESRKESAPRLNQFISTYTCDLFGPRPPRQSADWVYFTFSLSSSSDRMRYSLSSLYRISALISQSQMFFFFVIADKSPKRQRSQCTNCLMTRLRNSSTHCQLLLVILQGSRCWGASNQQAMRADPPVLSASLLCSHLQQLSDPSTRIA